jgi:hypothetical protein
MDWVMNYPCLLLKNFFIHSLYIRRKRGLDSHPEVRASVWCADQGLRQIAPRLQGQSLYEKPDWA